MRLAARSLCFIGGIAMIMFPGISRAAELKVLCDGPLAPILPGLVEGFHRDTGHTVNFVFAPAPVLADRVSRGEIADVVIVRPDEIDELVKAGKVAVEGQEVVVRIGTAIFVRDDVPAPDISSPDAFKRTILAADSVSFAYVGTGIDFANLLQRLGITATMKDKVMPLPPAEVFANVLKRKGNDVGASTITSINGMRGKGIKMVGPLPGNYQAYLVLAAAMMADAPSPEPARQFIRFLVSPSSHAAFGAAGAS